MAGEIDSAVQNLEATGAAIGRSFAQARLCAPRTGLDSFPFR